MVVFSLLDEKSSLFNLLYDLISVFLSVFGLHNFDFTDLFFVSWQRSANYVFLDISLIKLWQKSDASGLFRHHQEASALHFDLICQNLWSFISISVITFNLGLIAVLRRIPSTLINLYIN